MRSQKLEYNCKACGACCVADKPTDFVAVTALDRRRLPTKYQNKVVDNDIDKTTLYKLPNKRSGVYTTCTALKGKVGKSVMCDVYHVRPNHCRYAITKGDAECEAARKRLGLYIHQKEQDNEATRVN